MGTFNNNNRNTGNQYSKNRNEEIVYNWYFMKHKFCDEDGILRENLVTREAKEIAEDLKKKGTSTQLRAFFAEIKGFRNRILEKEEELQEEEFKKIYPLILMIKSKINYRYEKEQGKLSCLKQFLDAGIDVIQKENKEGRGCKAFLDFGLFFETVVGYFGDKDR